MGSNKPSEKYVVNYSPECPICKGVMLPERVAELEKDVEKLEGQLQAAQSASDRWRDLYQAASGHHETGLEYRNWDQEVKP